MLVIQKDGNILYEAENKCRYEKYNEMRKAGNMRAHKTFYLKQATLAVF